MKYLILFALFVATVPVFSGQYEAGKIIEGIRCADDLDYSYLLYLPSSYDATRADKYPVLFVMGAGGGSPRSLKRYLYGAEKNNWILAMSKESKNHYKKSHEAIHAMVDDVFDRFHVNEKRCYSTGMSGGGREAFWLANTMKSNIIGIIPCGAGDCGNEYRNKALAYGLCGGYCFNRWDMAVTFNERIEDDGRLRFFPGGHVWAGEELIFDAITWLNAAYLDKKGREAEIAAFSEMLFAEIQKKYEEDPYFAYENLVVLSEMRKAPHAAKAKKILAQLNKDPRVQVYVAGLKDMDKFVDKHFNTDVMDYRDNPCTSRQTKDSYKLQAKYADTPLAPTIEQFGKPSKKFN